MTIEELDEWQGLTCESVSEWLRSQGFDMRLGGLLHAGGYLVHWEPIASARQATEDALHAVVQYRKQSLQSLLREINPRMRKGMPSEAARDVHDGFWLAVPDFACMGAHAPIVVTFDGDGFGVWHPEGFALPDSTPKHAHLWHFWPCDEHGNKVRWPVDAEGKML